MSNGECNGPVGNTFKWAHEVSVQVQEQKPKEGLYTVNYTPNPIEIVLQNGAAPGPAINLEQRQKRMLAYIVGITQAKIDSYTEPWVTRADISALSQGEYTTHQSYRILNHLIEGGLMEQKLGIGYHLLVDPRDVSKVLVNYGEKHSLRRKQLNDWHDVKVQAKIFPQYMIPVIKAVSNQLSEAKPSDTHLDIHKIITESGLSRKMAYAYLVKLGDSIFLRREKGQAYNISDINQQLLKEVIKTQRPFTVSAQLIDPRSGPVRETNGERLSHRAQQKKEERQFIPNTDLLASLADPFSKEIEGASSRGNPGNRMLLPIALIRYYRTLSRKDEVVPWKELKQLKLAGKDRDHHWEGKLVAGLLAALYLNEKVHKIALALNQGSESAVESVAFHTAHLLRVEANKIHSGAKSSAEPWFIQSTITSLEDVGIRCACPECQNKNSS